MAANQELQILRELDRAKAAGNSKAELALLRRLESISPAQPEAQPVTQPEENQSNALLGTARSALQGMTFNFSDEIGLGAAAALGWATHGRQKGESFWDIYEGMRENYRAEQQQFEQEHRKTAIASEIVGGFATGGVGGAKVLGKKLLLHPFKSAAKVGAVTGGIAGAGTAASISDIPGEVVEGAIKGGVAGPVTLGIMKGVALPFKGAAWGVKKMGEALRGPETRAQRIVAEGLKRESMSPIQAASKMRQLGPDAVLSDVGPSMQNLGRDITAIPGPQVSQATKTLRTRAQAAPQRFLRDLKRLSGADDSFYETSKKVIERRSAEAGPHYKAAENQPVGEDALGNVMTEIDRHMGKYIRTPLGNRLEHVRSMFFIDKTTPKATIGQWHAVKENIDDIIGAAHKSGNSNAVRVLTDVKKTMLREMDSVSPDYAKGRSIFSTESDFLDAMEKGRKLLKEDAFKTEELLSGMSQAEKEAFRMGAVKEIRDNVLSVVKGGDVSRRLNTPLLYERIRPMFPSEQSYQTFIRAINREQTFAETANKALAGSPTARIQEGVHDLSSKADIAIDAISGNPGRATYGFVKQFLSRRTQLPEDVREEVGKLLFTPGAGQKVIAKLRQSNLRQEQIDKFLSGLNAGIAAAGAQQTVGVETE